MNVLLFQILKSKSEFNFVHRALPHARSKRSVPHMRKLKVDPSVSFLALLNLPRGNERFKLLFLNYYISTGMPKFPYTFWCHTIEKGNPWVNTDIQVGTYTYTIDRLTL